MVGQHGDGQEEPVPQPIWLMLRRWPRTAVILPPNIWVIARRAWELAAAILSTASHTGSLPATEGREEKGSLRCRPDLTTQHSTAQHTHTA